MVQAVRWNGLVQAFDEEKIGRWRPTSAQSYYRWNKSPTSEFSLNVMNKESPKVQRSCVKLLLYFYLVMRRMISVSAMAGHRKRGGKHFLLAALATLFLCHAHTFPS